MEDQCFQDVFLTCVRYVVCCFAVVVLFFFLTFGSCCFVGFHIPNTLSYSTGVVLHWCLRAFNHGCCAGGPARVSKSASRLFFCNVVLILNCFTPQWCHTKDVTAQAHEGQTRPNKQLIIRNMQVYYI